MLVDVATVGEHKQRLLTEQTLVPFSANVLRQNNIFREKCREVYLSLTAMEALSLEASSVSDDTCGDVTVIQWLLSTLTPGV